MIEATAVDIVLRTLADPTRRAVFERIVQSDEISVVELTRGSGVTQSAVSQHLRSPSRSRPDHGLRAGPQRLLSQRAEGAGPAVRLDEPLRRVLAQALRQPPNPLEGDRSMNEAAFKSDTQAIMQESAQDIVVDEVFPHTPEVIWKTLTSGELMGRWLMAPTGFEPVKRQALHLPDHGGRRLGRGHPLRGAGGDPEPTPRLCLERRTRRKRRLRLTAGHGRDLHAFQSGKRNAASPGPFRLRAAEERDRFHQHERRLEKKVVPQIGTIAGEQDHATGGSVAGRFRLAGRFEVT